MFSINRDGVMPTSGLETLYGYARDAHERLEDLHAMLLAWRNEVNDLAALWHDAAGRSVMERNILPLTQAREEIGADLTHLAEVNDEAGAALVESWAQSCYARRTMEQIDQSGSTLMARLPAVRAEIAASEAQASQCESLAWQASAQIPG